MNQDFAESVARYRAELASAVTRAKRAAADARAQTTRFRSEVEEPDVEPAVAPTSDPDDEDFSDHSILFRP